MTLTVPALEKPVFVNVSLDTISPMVTVCVVRYPGIYLFYRNLRSIGNISQISATTL